MPLNRPSNTHDYEVVLLTLEENSVSQVQTKVLVGDRGTVSGKVYSPKNQVYALLKNTVDVNLIHDEVLLNLGLAQYYKVLSFRDSRDHKVLLIQCTPFAKVQEAIRELNMEGYVLVRHGGQSNALLLRQNQRLWMDIRGNIEKYVDYPQVAYFITVLFGAHDQKTIFPYHLKGTIGGTHFGILTISSDNFKRGELWSLHFEPDLMIRRQNSMI